MKRRMILKKLEISIAVLTILVSANGIGHAVVVEDAGGQNAQAIENKEGLLVPEEGRKQEPEYVPGEVLVKFKEGAEPTSILMEAGIEAQGVERVHSIKPVVAKFKKDYKLEKDSEGGYPFLGKKYKEVSEIPDEKMFKEAYKKMTPQRRGLYRKYKIDLPEGVSVEEAVAKLKNNPDVEYAYPNYIREAYAFPNDPRFSEQWALHNTGQNGGTPDADIDAAEAWDITPGNPNIVIAIIDTGVDYNHQDLAANVWINSEDSNNNHRLDPGEDRNGNGVLDYNEDLNHNGIVDSSDFNGVDDDGNGFIDDVRGWDFVSVPSDVVATGEDPGPPDNDTMDVQGHGTHVAGIAAAVRNNSIGIAGVAPGCRIMALRAGYKAKDGYGYLRDSDIEQAILYAVDHGARVINMSFGSDDLGAWEDEIRTGYGEGVVFVAAAGNGDTLERHYPSAMDEVIAVAATDKYNRKTDFSNYGSWIEVGAPGKDILSTVPNKGYELKGGTSMACPHVAGIAALVLSIDSALTAEQVRNVVRNSATDIGYVGRDCESGFGLVNAEQALQDMDTTSYPTAIISTPIYYDIVNNERYEIKGTVGEGFEHYDVEVSLSSVRGEETDFRTIVSNVTTPVPPDGTLAIWNTSESAYDEVWMYRVLRLNVYDAAGNVQRFSVPVRVDPMLLDGWPIRERYRSWSSPIVEDIDGNGIDEIITTTENYVFVYKGDGSLLWSRHLRGNQLGPEPAVGDLNPQSPGLEIAIGTTGFADRSNLYIFNSDGTDAEGWPVLMSQSNNPAIIADFDGDDYNEVLFCTGSAKDGTVDNLGARIFLYEGDGTLLRHIRLFSSDEATTNNAWVRGLAAADIDGDGAYEILVSLSLESNDANEWGAVRVYDYLGNELVWARMVPERVGRCAMSNQSLAVGDLNGDGNIEVIAATLDDRIYTWTLNADARTATLLPNWPIHLGVSDNYYFKYISLANFDTDDNILEIIFTLEYASSDYVHVVRIDGGSYPPFPMSWRESSLPAIIGDVDGDGELELVHTDKVARGTGIFNLDGSLLDGFPKFYYYWNFSRAPALGDVNGDGGIDFVIANQPKKEIAVFSLGQTGALAWPMRYHDAQNTNNYNHKGRNRPPIMVHIGNKTVDEGTLLEFTVNATDPDDGDTLKYSARGLPQGASFNPQTRVFSWTPGYNQAGTYTGVHFEVRDGQLQDSEDITITVNNVNRPPTCVSVSAVSVIITNINTSVSAVYADPDGYQDLENVELLVNSSVSFANCISLRYDRLNNKLYLRSDDGSSWLGGFAPRSNNTIENSFAKLICSGSRVDTILPDRIRVVFYLRVKPNAAFTGQKNIYLYAKDTTGAESGWQQKGTVIIENRPTIVSFSPNSGTFRLNTQLLPFNSQFSDLDGFNDIYTTSLLISTGMHFQNALYARYNKVQNKLYLWNGGRFVGGFTPESNNVIETPYGNLYCAQTTVPPPESGTNLTVNWSLSFKIPLLGTRKVYLSVSDRQGRQTGWVQVGNITVEESNQPKLPVITSIRLYWGMTGTRITITGSNFLEMDINSKVTFSFHNYHKTAQIISWKDNEIICYVPKLTYRYRWYKLWVSTKGGQSNYRWFYYY